MFYAALWRFRMYITPRNVHPWPKNEHFHLVTVKIWLERAWQLAISKVT